MVHFHPPLRFCGLRPPTSLTWALPLDFAESFTPDPYGSRSTLASAVPAQFYPRTSWATYVGQAFAYAAPVELGIRFLTISKTSALINTSRRHFEIFFCSY